MCKSTNKIERYINNGKSTSKQNDVSIGLSNSVVKNMNGILNCQFKRIKYSPTTNYFNLFNPCYVLLAKGSLSGGIRINDMLFDYAKNEI